MGLKWAAKVCPDARFYAFVDDDYYVSTRNLLRFLRNPVNYPRYLQDPTIDFDDVLNQNKVRPFDVNRLMGQLGKTRGKMLVYDLPIPRLSIVSPTNVSSRPLISVRAVS